MNAVRIGAFAMALLGSASAGWAIPIAPAPVLAATPSAPLLFVRHHHHHGHWRHGPRPDSEPEAVAPDTEGGPFAGSNTRRFDRPAASVPPPQGASNREGRASGSSAPAIRWVNPEKSGR